MDVSCILHKYRVKIMKEFKAKVCFYFEVAIFVLLPALGYVAGLFLYIWEYGIEGRKPHRVPGLNKRGMR